MTPFECSTQIVERLKSGYYEDLEPFPKEQNFFKKSTGFITEKNLDETNYKKAVDEWTKKRNFKLLEFRTDLEGCFEIENNLKATFLFQIVQDISQKNGFEAMFSMYNKLHILVK